jgi:lipoate-protein ligase A
MSHRGEFKTPGGKLIAVELDVVDGQLRNVVVTGDFFLYPEEALPLLAGALEHSPAALDEAGYAARVRGALDAGVELVGSSPEALAVAVVRALGSGAATKAHNDD